MVVLDASFPLTSVRSLMVHSPTTMEAQALKRSTGSHARISGSHSTTVIPAALMIPACKNADTGDGASAVWASQRWAGTRPVRAMHAATRNAPVALPEKLMASMLSVRLVGTAAAMTASHTSTSLTSSQVLT